jgi:hypothetical protein
MHAVRKGMSDVALCEVLAGYGNGLLIGVERKSSARSQNDAIGKSEHAPPSPIRSFTAPIDAAILS